MDIVGQSKVKVLFDFQYTPSGSSKSEPQVKIFKNEELVLLRKATAVWWQVIRVDELKPFYAPAEYLREKMAGTQTTDRMKPKVNNLNGKSALGRKRSNSLDTFVVTTNVLFSNNVSALSSAATKPAEKRSSWAVAPYSVKEEPKNSKRTSGLSEFRRCSVPEDFPICELDSKKSSPQIASDERIGSAVVSEVETKRNITTPIISIFAATISAASATPAKSVQNANISLEEEKNKQPRELLAGQRPAFKAPLAKPLPPKLPPKVAKKPMPAPRENISLKSSYVNLSQTDIPRPSVAVDSAKGSGSSSLLAPIDKSINAAGQKGMPQGLFARQRTIAVIEMKPRVEISQPKVRPPVDLNKYKSSKQLAEKPKMPTKSKTYVSPSKTSADLGAAKPLTRKPGVFSRLFHSKEPLQPIVLPEKNRKLSSEKMKSPLFQRKTSKHDMSVVVPVTINEHECDESEGQSLFMVNPLVQLLRQPSLMVKKTNKNSPGSVETLSSGTGLQDSSSELEDRGSKNSLDSLGSAFTSESTSGIASESPGARSPSSQDETRSEEKLKLSASASDPSNVYANVNYCSFPVIPPSPGPKDLPVRQLHDGWAEYSDHGGRIYYYQTGSGARSWKPPRKRTGSPKLGNCSGDEENVSPLPNSDLSTPDPFALGERPKLKRELSTFGVSAASKSDVNGNSASRKPRRSEDGLTIRGAPLPPGWIQRLDSKTDEKVYVHPFSKTKWYTSVDKEGRLYYFEENSNESVWVLPDVQPVTKEPSGISNQFGSTANETFASLERALIQNDQKPGAVKLRPPKEGSVDRKPQAKSQVILDSSFSSGAVTRADLLQKTASLPRDASQLPYLKVICQGQLNKTKITENGKKLRKNWTSSYCILSDQLLVLYKDAKSATYSRSGTTPAKPELSMDLNGASIEWSSNKSSRKNVFQLSTVFGVQVLFQDEDRLGALQWYKEVETVIRQLPAGKELLKMDLNSSSSSEYLDRSPGISQGLSLDDGKKSKLARTKSTKLKSASIEDLTEIDGDRNVRERLRQFFGRRPTVEAITKKGYFKDEAVFGSTLKALLFADKSYVPKFVEYVIHVLESKQEHLETDGLYRASGNLSQVQKIRLNADQYKFECIDQEEDVHVLTGALKLFFRELKEPAIPSSCFEKSLEISGNKNRSERIKKFRDLLNSFPKENYETLKFLFTHLLKVTDFREKNRMHVSNLAIVFGPTLMWPATVSLNLALDMMQQNLVIECLLLEFKQVFVK